jgi:hypothetical protein
MNDSSMTFELDEQPSDSNLSKHMKTALSQSTPAIISNGLYLFIRHTVKKVAYKISLKRNNFQMFQSDDL